MTKYRVTTFGQHIRGLRENSGLPIKQIAAQIDIDPSLLGKIERNERPPTKDLIAKIAKAYCEDEKFLIKQVLSDQFASRILEEEADIEILKVAEQKVKFQINRRKNKSKT